MKPNLTDMNLILEVYNTIQDQEKCDALHPNECKELDIGKRILAAAEVIKDQADVADIISAAQELINMHTPEEDEADEMSSDTKDNPTA